MYNNYGVCGVHHSSVVISRNVHTSAAYFDPISNSWSDTQCLHGL